MMDEETAVLISKFLDLGLVGVLAVQSVILYRQLMSMTDRYVAHLERISERLALLQTPPAVPVFLDDGVAARGSGTNDLTI